MSTILIENQKSNSYLSQIIRKCVEADGASTKIAHYILRILDSCYCFKFSLRGSSMIYRNFTKNQNQYLR